MKSRLITVWWLQSGSPSTQWPQIELECFPHRLHSSTLCCQLVTAGLVNTMNYNCKSQSQSITIWLLLAYVCRIYDLLVNWGIINHNHNSSLAGGRLAAAQRIKSAAGKLSAALPPGTACLFEFQVSFCHLDFDDHCLYVKYVWGIRA